MTETKNYYKTPINCTDHTRYGGEITEWDFNGHPTLSDIAKDIAKAQGFDEKCRRNIESKKHGGQSAFFTVKDGFKEK